MKLTEDSLILFLKWKKGVKLLQIADHFDRSPSTILKIIKNLKKKNIIFDIIDDRISLATQLKPIEKPIVVDFFKYKEIEYPIGFVADQHIGSKYERIDVLEALYDRFSSYGIKTVYQGGNIIDGECKFNKYDIYVHGVEDQVQNLVKKYPKRKGIITKFITADDHEGWYVQREHINIGKKIEDEAIRSGRHDLVHIGYMERDIVFKQRGGSSIIRIIHGGGGTSYALSYSSQKYAESLQGGEKPNIVLTGHYHKWDWAYPREIHIIQGGTTCDQTPFMRKRKIQAMVGGVVLWVKQNTRGLFVSVKAEWIPFYDKKFYAYKW